MKCQGKATQPISLAFFVFSLFTYDCSVQTNTKLYKHIETLCVGLEVDRTPKLNTSNIDTPNFEHFWPNFEFQFFSDRKIVYLKMWNFFATEHWQKVYAQKVKLKKNTAPQMFVMFAEH